MDAPIYAPATRFEQPEVIPQFLSARDTPIADLRAHPEAWAIVLNAFPNFEARLNSEAIKPHLGSFSLRTLTQFGMVKADALADVDAQLRTLGEVK